jgi:hypothetical protein
VSPPGTTTTLNFRTRIRRQEHSKAIIGSWNVKVGADRPAVTFAGQRQEMEAYAK